MKDKFLLNHFEMAHQWMLMEVMQCVINSRIEAARYLEIAKAQQEAAENQAKFQREMLSKMLVGEG